MPGAAVHAQQVVDTTYRPRPAHPAWAAGRGPRVVFDASHNNPSILSELRPLRTLLEADGYTVDRAPDGLSSETLAQTDILVVVDALADRNVDNWTLPSPSALDAPARERIVEWVRRGGQLLLAADHMPFAGAASDLGKDLGFEMLNGFAIDTATWDPLVFRRSDGSIRDHPITRGRTAAERVDSVSSYWGHAFRRSSGTGSDLLVLPAGIVSMQPREAWRFDADTEVLPVEGWAHGAIIEIGRGRVVVLGDSGLLGAYFVGPARQPVGLNATGQNEQFALNIFHWLSGLTGVEMEGREGRIGGSMEAAGSVLCCRSNRRIR